MSFNILASLMSLCLHQRVQRRSGHRAAPISQTQELSTKSTTGGEIYFKCRCWTRGTASGDKKAAVTAQHHSSHLLLPIREQTPAPVSHFQILWVLSCTFTLWRNAANEIQLRKNNQDKQLNQAVVILGFKVGQTNIQEHLNMK